jgi:hypothetical protein
MHRSKKMDNSNSTSQPTTMQASRFMTLPPPNIFSIYLILPDILVLSDHLAPFGG